MPPLFTFIRMLYGDWPYLYSPLFTCMADGIQSKYHSFYSPLFTCMAHRLQSAKCHLYSPLFAYMADGVQSKYHYLYSPLSTCMVDGLWATTTTFTHLYPLVCCIAYGLPSPRFLHLY